METILYFIISTKFVHLIILQQPLKGVTISIARQRPSCALSTPTLMERWVPPSEEECSHLANLSGRALEE